MNKSNPEGKGVTKEIKVSAYNSHCIPLAHSNFVKMSGKDNNHDREYFYNIIKQSNMGSKKMVDTLNNNKNVFGKWKVKEKSDDKITLETKDGFGNISHLDIKKVEKKVIKPKSGQISASNSHGVSESLSNFVSTESGGFKEASEYFKNEDSPTYHFAWQNA